MDIATAIGVIGGIATICTLIIIDGGNFAAYCHNRRLLLLQRVRFHPDAVST